MFLFLDSNTYTKNISCCFSEDVAHEIGVTKWFYRKRGNPEQQLITSRKDIASAFKILKSGTLEIIFFTNYSGIYTCESEEDNVSFTYVVDGNIFFICSSVLLPIILIVTFLFLYSQVSLKLIKSPILDHQSNLSSGIKPLKI